LMFCILFWCCKSSNKCCKSLFRFFSRSFL
jgi:hypothetical protein